MNDIIIIPDVHGRRFWRSAMSRVNESAIVFLGDYLDPYWGENISQEDSYEEMEEILSWKHRYPERVSLLLGNHDLHYLSSTIGGCRYDYENAYRNKAFFWSNLNYFDLAYAYEISDRQYLLTHAGVLRYWFEKHFHCNEHERASQIADRLNGRLHNAPTRPALLKDLSESSILRGGSFDCGSCVWADVGEHDDHGYEFDGVYQIFGHTLGGNPTVTPYWACLDCRRAFVLNHDSGEIKELG